VRLLRDLRDWCAHPISLFLFRIALAAVFLAAALPKIRDPFEFAWAVHRYGILPEAWEAAFAVFLPVLELWVALALLLGFWSRAASLLCAGMLVIFIAALYSAIERGLNIDCGCFDPKGASPVGYRRIAEDVALLVACLPPLIWSSGRYGLDSLSRRSSPD